MLVASADVWIPLLVGIMFAALACFKLYGLARGIEGGAGKTMAERLCGT